LVTRRGMFARGADLTRGEPLARGVAEQHSRIPVYDPLRGPEHIGGVLYVRGVMRWLRLRLGVGLSQPTAARISTMQISQIMRNVLVVPETKIVTDLLFEFKERRRHLAVVVDEFGSTAG